MIDPAVLADILTIKHIRDTGMCSHSHLGEAQDLLDRLAAQSPMHGGQYPTSGEETILEEAQRIVNGPRRETYQHPYDDHTALGRVWAGILSKHLRQDVPDLPAHVVSMMMVGVKVIREVGIHGRDNLVDVAGYAYCADIEYEEGVKRSV